MVNTLFQTTPLVNQTALISQRHNPTQHVQSRILTTQQSKRRINLQVTAGVTQSHNRHKHRKPSPNPPAATYDPHTRPHLAFSSTSVTQTLSTKRIPGGVRVWSGGRGETFRPRRSAGKTLLMFRPHGCPTD